VTAPMHWNSASHGIVAFSAGQRFGRHPDQFSVGVNRPRFAQ
jgi:hypothetical protein